MLALMQEDQNDGKMKPRWLGVALAYFHDLPIKTAEKVGDEDVMADGEQGDHVKGEPHPANHTAQPADNTSACSNTVCVAFSCLSGG